jgi:hypothetical protein
MLRRVLPLAVVAASLTFTWPIAAQAQQAAPCLSARTYQIIDCKQQAAEIAADEAARLAAINAIVQELVSQADLEAAQANNTYLGQLGGSPFAVNSTSNASGPYGSVSSPTSIRNPTSAYGSRVSPQSATNPYATATPSIVGHDGTYLGKLSANPYDPDSVSNPYGRYGSRYSPTSINNPYGQYGSRYSPLSPNNPYTMTAPSIISTPTIPAIPALPALPSLPALPTLPPLGQ